MFIYFSLPIFSMYKGLILVPTPSTPLIRKFDANGEAYVKLIWSSLASAGDEFAVQVDAITPNNSLTRSNAVIGTTMTGAEAAAYSYAEVASKGWRDIDVVSVEEALVIATSIDVESGVDLVLSGSFPDATEDVGVSTFNLTTLSLAGITAAEWASFRGDVRPYVSLGDTAIKVKWHHDSLGDFESYSIFRGMTSGIGLDGFEFLMPDVFPMPISAAPSGGFRTTPVDVGSTWPFGYQARVTGSVAVGCDSSGHVQGCGMNATSISPAPTWDAQHSFECAPGISDNCCYCTFNIAIVSGFKSISVDGLGGFTVSGNIGYSLRQSYAMKACCD